VIQDIKLQIVLIKERCYQVTVSQLLADDGVERMEPVKAAVRLAVTQGPKAGFYRRSAKPTVMARVQ